MVGAHVSFAGEARRFRSYLVPNEEGGYNFALEAEYSGRISELVIYVNRSRECGRVANAGVRDQVCRANGIGLLGDSFSALFRFYLVLAIF